MKHLVLALLRGYRRFVSPLFGPVCRYYPTCSTYALQAVQVHGAARGSWLGLRRVLRCHPWSDGGYDPVPGTPEADAWAREQAAKSAPSSTTPSASPAA